MDTEVHAKLEKIAAKWCGSIVPNSFKLDSVRDNKQKPGVLVILWSYNDPPEKEPHKWKLLLQRTLGKKVRVSDCELVMNMGEYFLYINLIDNTPMSKRVLKSLEKLED